MRSYPKRVRSASSQRLASRAALPRKNSARRAAACVAWKLAGLTPTGRAPATADGWAGGDARTRSGAAQGGEGSRNMAAQSRPGGTKKQPPAEPRHHLVLTFQPDCTVCK